MDDEPKAVKAAGLFRGRSSSVREVEQKQPWAAPEDRASQLEGHARGKSMETPEELGGHQPLQAYIFTLPWRNEESQTIHWDSHNAWMYSILFF